MRNCFFCHRPISGEAYEFRRVLQLLLGQTHPSRNIEYALQHAHVDCMEKAERCFIEPQPCGTVDLYQKFMRERGL